MEQRADKLVEVIILGRGAVQLFVTGRQVPHLKSSDFQSTGHHWMSPALLVRIRVAEDTLDPHLLLEMKACHCLHVNEILFRTYFEAEDQMLFQGGHKCQEPGKNRYWEFLAKYVGGTGL